MPSRLCLSSVLRTSFYTLLLSATCAATLQVWPASAKTAVKPAPQPYYANARTSGDYLAGTYFYRLNSMEAAFHHYNRIGRKNLSGEAGYRYMISAVLTGHIKEAAEAAGEGDIHRGRILPALTEMAEALKQQDWRQLTRIMNLKASVSGMDGDGTIGDYTMVPLIRAWSLAATGDYAKAKDILGSDAAEKFFTGHFLTLQHALLADVAGKKSEAATYYTKLAEQDILPYYYVRLIGNYYEREGAAAKAAALYRAYREREKRPYMFQDALARVDENNTPAAAVPDFTDGVGIVLLETARVLSAHDMSAEAMLYARLSAYISPNLPDAYLIMSEYYNNSGANDIPRDIVSALARFPDMEIDATLIRAAVFTGAEHYDEAEKLLEELSNRFPAYPNPGLAYADVLRQQKNYKKAAEFYANVLKVTPSEDVTWNMYFALAICHERMDEWPKAERYLKRALAKEPEQADVLNYLAYGWLERDMRMKEALKMTQNALKNSPDSPHITDSLGWAYFKMKRYDEAVKLLEKAAEGLPQDPVINDHLGDAYWQLGRENEAAFQWRRALKYDEEGVYDPEKLKAKIEFGYNGASTVSADGKNVITDKVR